MVTHLCADCSQEWWQGHKPTCQRAAKEFVEEVSRDGWATAKDYPRCPKCGDSHIWWTDNAPAHATDGSKWTIQCRGCDHEYPVELVIDYSFRVANPEEMS